MVFSEHGGYAVPVRRDVDGEPLVLCYLDSETGAGPAEYWAVWCTACREVVSPPLDGSLGLLDLDGAPDWRADLVFRDEQRMSVAHAAAMTPQPWLPPVTFPIGAEVRAGHAGGQSEPVRTSL